MKTLVFDESVFGHHLEYLHHIYMRAVELPHKHFVFAVPEDFHSVSSKMEWPKVGNVEFVFFDVTLARTPLSRSRLLGRLVKEHKIDEVMLISLMSFLPWLPLFVSSKVKVSGIVYLIYLYRWAKSGWKTRILDVLKYLIFSKCKVFHRVFLLNDKVSPRYLNRKFKTNKFRWLPDPVAISSDEDVPDLKKEWSLKENVKVFSHFGALSKRKGTLEILKAIIASDEDVLSRSFFVFAGKVGQDIREEFYRLLSEAEKRGAQVKVFDEFCSYSFLLGLSRASSAILIPYMNTEQSSGVVAYAAFARTPVFSPRGGLLGSIVKHYKLGWAVPDVTSEGIEKIFNTFPCQPFSGGSGANYLYDNSLEKFQRLVVTNE